ncbi:hypothetical protein D3C80_1931340 [compost metagenome]
MRLDQLVRAQRSVAPEGELTASVLHTLEIAIEPGHTIEESALLGALVLDPLIGLKPAR